MEEKHINYYLILILLLHISWEFGKKWWKSSLRAWVVSCCWLKLDFLLKVPDDMIHKLHHPAISFSKILWFWFQKLSHIFPSYVVKLGAKIPCGLGEINDAWKLERVVTTLNKTKISCILKNHFRLLQNKISICIFFVDEIFWCIKPDDLFYRAILSLI